MVHISFASLLNSAVARVVLARQFVGGMSQILAEVVWVAWTHTVLVQVEENDKGWIFLWVKHMILWTFIMILWSFIDLSCDSILFSVVSAHTVFEPSTQFIFHYFIEKCIKCQISSFKTSVFFRCQAATNLHHFCLKSSIYSFTSL